MADPRFYVHPNEFDTFTIMDREGAKPICEVGGWALACYVAGLLCEHAEVVARLQQFEQSREIIP